MPNQPLPVEPLAPPSEPELDLKRELLRVVLANTLKKAGVPAPWISGEINPMNLPTGELRIEVRLSLQVDEPRLLAYLTSFQADFERRLLRIAPDAKEWVSGILWSLTPDPIFEVPLPTPQFWEHVIADRQLTAHQKGGVPWDREAMERHFLDTDPGDLVVDFADTTPPQREVEDLPPAQDGPMR